MHGCSKFAFMEATLSPFVEVTLKESISISGELSSPRGIPELALDLLDGSPSNSNGVLFRSAIKEART